MPPSFGWNNVGVLDSKKLGVSGRFQSFRHNLRTWCSLAVWKPRCFGNYRKDSLEYSEARMNVRSRATEVHPMSPGQADGHAGCTLPVIPKFVIAVHVILFSFF